MSAAPDLIDPVVGFHHWRIDDEALWSPYVGFRWVPGVNVASCAVMPAHDGHAPVHDCTCGLYAWYRPCPRAAVLGTRDLVAGAVAMWGALECHAGGVRAQYAAVVAIVIPLWCGRKRRRLLEIADLLGVEVVPARALKGVALAHGLPLPKAWAPRRGVA